MDRYAPVGSPSEFNKRQTNYDISKIDFPLYSTAKALNSSMTFNKTPQVKGSDKIDFKQQMSTKFSELHPTRLYPHPLEDAQRAATQADHKEKSQMLNKQALLDQIKYNHLKRRIEKE